MADKSGILAGIIRDFQAGATPTDVVTKYGVTISEIRSWAMAFSPKSVLFRQVNQFLEVARLHAVGPVSTSRFVIVPTTTTTSTTSTSTTAPPSLSFVSFQVNDEYLRVEGSVPMYLTTIGMINLTVNGDLAELVDQGSGDGYGTGTTLWFFSIAPPVDNNDTVTVSTSGFFADVDGNVFPAQSSVSVSNVTPTTTTTTTSTTTTSTTSAPAGPGVADNVLYYDNSVEPPIEAGFNVYGSNVGVSVDGSNNVIVSGNLGDVTSISASTSFSGTGKFNVAAAMTGLGWFGAYGQMVVDLGYVAAPAPDLYVGLGYNDNVNVMPILPATTNEIQLESMPSLDTVVLPADLEFLTFGNNGTSLGTIASWPSGLRNFYMYTLAVTGFSGWANLPNSLELLSIDDCENLLTMPPGFAALTNLNDIRITACPLVTIPPLPVSAKFVTVDGSMVNAAAANAIVARLVANGLTSGTLSMYGGVYPTGQRNNADVVTLTNRNWSISGIPF